MSDVLFLLLAGGFFLVASGLIVGCERLAAIDESDVSWLEPSTSDPSQSSDQSVAVATGSET